MNISEPMSLVASWSEEFRAGQNPQQPGWMRELRENAASQFGASGLPDRKTEAWKYTPLRLLEKQSPSAVVLPAAGPQVPDFPDPLCAASVGVVDILGGVLGDQLPQAGPGVSLLSLADGIETFGDRLQQLLTSVELEGASRVFSALNTAFLDQGLVVHVAENVNAGSLLLRWAFSPGQTARMGHFRIVLLLEPGSKLRLIEQFGSGAETGNTLNVITQAQLAEGAVLNHSRVQNECDSTVLLTSTSVDQEAASEYQYYGFDFGGGLVRHELSSRLGGPGAQAGFNGAFVLDGKRHVDNHVSVDHASPGCSSTQFFRGVLGGSSRGVFNGRALIRPGADESRVYQSNANLLLSPLAEMDTKPELEIYADEVEASHGATVGQLDDAAIFYLRSRGLSDGQARHMLTAAFCHAVSDRLEDREMAGRIADLLDAAMPGGTAGKGAGD